MKGFTGKRWQLWRVNASRTQEQHSRPENDSEISEPESGRKWRDLLMPRKLVLAGAAVVVIAGVVYWGGQQYVKANTVSYYRVYVSGKEIGTIASEAQLQALIERKEQEYKQKYPDVEMAVNTEGITIKPEQAYKAEVDAESTLDELYGMLTGYAKGVELKVDGKVIAVVKDQAAAREVLDRVKSTYAPDVAASTLAAKVKRTGGSKSAQVKTKASNATLETVEIAEEVNQGEVKADPNKVLSPEEAVRKILQGDEEAIQYEVQEGDTISSIAARFGVSQKELFANNPGVEELTLQIGTLLNVKAVQPALTVRTVEHVTEEIVTEPQVIVKTNASMRAGETKVISPGSSGLKTMEYRITKENGIVVNEEWLGQEVTKKSSPKIVVRGTKVVLGEGTGQFAWPVSSAKMTSSYGERWGRTHKGVDLVSSNRSILAADDGVVSFVGTKSGYGNCIIIDHKNGYETLYGHLSKISVKKGQIVEKGEKIGVMGSTGRSTGTHLHFEIHKNGSIQNPLKYL
ncbi:peptidoglycan DD-metalloendopeptidase family protein [Paenibacillus phoenicis]|uniref:Peptidoglycan DD-metalloendopeptidase family protein n=1 Tax=Paenibacillus phoenicis TaxID=554117 RepID=A0ABU5PQ47_9BACL|nr:MULTISPECIES: peptidoglycan DD-metalloendopeptidase family protein [Paenibacillus]EES74378.1 peptidase, M23 family [Paenibacillus sp. oral taxon 786 str. D14]MCT2196982.1 peptidoglycan DD-metalloendopeptidase family protein [Paenibacillus sp. p3-SID1389]MEA3571744.1 peptidoglycan DD-metalloendopeptidase family protein [Paenibacillus phoenicis]